jgi:outer membrane protein TolC
MKKISFFSLANLMLLALVVSPVPGQHTAKKIPLTKAIEEGLKSDYEYLNALLDQKRADLQHRLSAKDKLFRVDFDANYLYKSETMVIDLSSIQIPGSTTGPSKELEAGLNHNYDFNVGLSQPLFTGGILSNSIEMEEVRKAIQYNQKILKTNEIVSMIKNSFFQYLVLTHRKRSLQILEETLGLHRSRIENLRAEGLVRKTDLLETLSKIEEIKASISEVDMAIESEEIQFHKLCGFNPQEIDDTYKEEPITQHDATAYFKQNHPVLKTLQNQADMLSLQRKIVTGKYLPQINGFAQLHYGRPGVDFFAKKWSVYFQGGIVLTLPVFDWNRLRTEKRLLDFQNEKLDNQKNKFVQDVTASLATWYSSLQKLEDKKNHIDRLLEYSKEDAELKKALYEEREIPNIDYLEALLTREKNALLIQEIQIQIERVKVNINTLIGKNKEGLDEQK